MASPAQSLGAQAENYVAQHLKANGWTIIARNYRRFFGEIDIIAHNQHYAVIAFVEVKARMNSTIDLAQLISTCKQQKILLVAKEFLSTHTFNHVTYRCDVALVEHRNNQFHLRYIDNAFTFMD